MWVCGSLACSEFYVMVMYDTYIVDIHCSCPSCHFVFRFIQYVLCHLFVFLSMFGFELEASNIATNTSCH